MATFNDVIEQIIVKIFKKGGGLKNTSKNLYKQHFLRIILTQHVADQLFTIKHI